MKAMVVLSLMLVSGTVTAQTMEGTSAPVVVEVSRSVSPTEEVITLKTLGIEKVPKYHALIIGVSDYQNAGPGLPNLDMPARDAERLASILVDKYTFNPDNVTLLKSPTREDIINNFDRLTRSVTEKDNLLIFYAGHGFYDKGTDFGYWLPADSKVASASTSAWIPNSTIKDYVGAIKTKHTLLITDACFGGSIFKTRSVEGLIKQFNELYRDKSRKAMTSGN